MLLSTFFKSLLNIKRYHSIQSEFNPIPDTHIKKFNKTRPYQARHNLCNAPFRNLFFSITGEVTVCCYNTKYIIGNISENTIMEIWQGEKIKKLRNHISNNDLSLGCNSCKSELYYQVYDDVHIKVYDNYFETVDFPTSMEFQIDNTCNLECTMCTGDLSSRIAINRENRFELKNLYNQNFITQFTEFVPHLKSCSFSGGEPFLIQSYYQIWEIIFQTNPKCNIIVQTNGTILTDEIKNLLKKGIFHIGISLDSLDANTYSNIRKNAFLGNTLENLNYFKQYCHANNRSFSIAVCVMKQNWREIPALMEFCSSNNIILNFNTVKFPVKTALWVLDASELQEIITYYQSYIFSTKNWVQNKNNLSFKNLLRILIYWKSISLKWENNAPKPISEEEIQTVQKVLINNLKTSIGSFYEESPIKEYYNKSIIENLDNLINSFPNDEIKLLSLKIISSFDEEKILTNIFRENDESLKFLLKNIQKYPEIFNKN